MTDFLWHTLEYFAMDDRCLRQDDVACHAYYNTINLLGLKLNYRLASKNADVN